MDEPFACELKPVGTTAVTVLEEPAAVPGEAALLAEEGEQIMPRLEIDALEGGLVRTRVEAPGAATHLFLHILFHGELQRLFPDPAVVQV